MSPHPHPRDDMEAAGPTVIDQVLAGRCHERLDGPIPGAVDVGLGEVHVYASMHLCIYASDAGAIGAAIGGSRLRQ